MNSLLVCTNCNGTISRVTQVCPSCGAVTGHGRARSRTGSAFQPASQSVLTIVIDALRTSSGRRRKGTQSISKVVNES